MKPKKFLYLLIVIVIIALYGCAGGPYGELEIVEEPTDEGLRQQWNDYAVYYLRYYALVYKIKDERKINLSDSWIEITSEGMMAEADSEITVPTWVKEIHGNNQQMFGYLVHRDHDLPAVKIIDQNTVQIFYNRVATSGR